MKRRLLFINTKEKRCYYATLDTATCVKDPREDYLLFSGETLCQYLLRQHRESLIIAGGPLPYLSGNKITIGYISPITGFPHYSIVGGNAAAQLFYCGLDALCFISPLLATEKQRDYIVLTGRAPELIVSFKNSENLPAGQRSAYYWLLKEECDNAVSDVSIFTIGSAARQGMLSANLAVDAIYHAGRGGAGIVFRQYCAGLVLHGKQLAPSDYFSENKGVSPATPIGQEINNLLKHYCDRLSHPTGGTITKLYTTGGGLEKQDTLPSCNAQRLGYSQADIGSKEVLRLTRMGKTGCYWCSVACRHWHHVPANYAPDGLDIYLDDFEPTYALFSMLDLKPRDNTLSSKIRMLADVNKRLILPIEELGCDIINTGLALSALFEGIEKGLVPAHDLPPFLRGEGQQDKLESSVRIMNILNSGEGKKYPALYAIAHGPQALADTYIQMKDIVFTCGRGTLGNPGHCNTLWTFLLPFSRFFGHYVGQVYKIDEKLPPPGSDEGEYIRCFHRVVERMLQREFFLIIGNALSQCGFTFIIFSQNGAGEALSSNGLLLRVCREYDIHITEEDLTWFSRAYWAQSIDLKCSMGFHPPKAGQFPHRIFEALSIALGRPVDELVRLMDLLIDIWKEHAEAVLTSFGYRVVWKEERKGQHVLDDCTL
jgi:hypothetical protein